MSLFSCDLNHTVSLHLCRSTVEFAREVSEAKAMDDTVNKLEQMFSGGGESPASGPRRGTSPTTINWGNPKKQEVGTWWCIRERMLIVKYDRSHLFPL